MGCLQIQANTGYDKSAVCKKDAECNDRSKIGVLQSISCDLECFNYLAWDEIYLFCISSARYFDCVMEKCGREQG